MSRESEYDVIHNDRAGRQNSGRKQSGYGFEDDTEIGLDEFGGLGSRSLRSRERRRESISANGGYAEYGDYREREPRPARMNAHNSRQEPNEGYLGKRDSGGSDRLVESRRAERGEDYFDIPEARHGRRRPTGADERYADMPQSDSRYDSFEPARGPAAADGGNNGMDKHKRKKKTLIISIGISLILINMLLVTWAMLGFGNDGMILSLAMAFNNMTDEQTDAMLKPYFDKRLEQGVCEVNIDGTTKALNLVDCEFAYSGLTGSSASFKTTIDAETGETVVFEYALFGMIRYNQTKLKSFLDSFISGESVPAVDSYYTIDYEASTITVFAGTDGWGVDTHSFIADMLGKLGVSAQNRASTQSVCGAVAARGITASELCERARSEAKDAYSTTNEAGETVYYSEIIGVSIDLGQAQSALSAPGSQWVVPVTITQPKMTLKELKKYTFPDLLATYYTYYAPGNRERSHNLALAAEHISGLVMEPGDQFSFNDKVGKRTAANGFKIAAVYAGEGTAEDFGGGICQTSSTLYYTCILANLQIDERHNHMYTVGYMQSATKRATVYGNDATVNWGSADYKFTNSKEYPIRIDIAAKDGILTCEIRGTADGSTADFAYDQIETTPYKIKYLPAGNLPNQSGHTGRKVHVYRIIYQDGVEVDRKLESKNTYKPMNEVFYTNELPEGFEYNVEYEQGFDPSTTTTTTTATTTTTTTTSETEGGTQEPTAVVIG